jgi:hypothetical protein
MAWGGGQQQNRGGGNGGQHGGAGGQSKPNTGALFENNRKEQDSHPDQNGSCEFECPHCGGTWASWISGWFKESKKDGKQFLSLSFRPKDQQGQGGGNRGGGGGQQRSQGGGQQNGGSNGGGGGWNNQRNGQQRQGGFQGSSRAGPNVSGNWRENPPRNGGGDIDDHIPF